MASLTGAAERARHGGAPRRLQVTLLCSWSLPPALALPPNLASYPPPRTRPPPPPLPLALTLTLTLALALTLTLTLTLTR